MERKPKIAILRWEQGITPPAFMQLEQMPGNSTNLDSYPFPVKLVEVKGAGVETVITNPSKKLLADMIELSKKARGISGNKVSTVNFMELLQNPEVHQLYCSGFHINFSYMFLVEGNQYLAGITRRCLFDIICQNIATLGKGNL